MLIAETITVPMGLVFTTGFDAARAQITRRQSHTTVKVCKWSYEMKKMKKTKQKQNPSLNDCNGQGEWSGHSESFVVKGEKKKKKPLFLLCVKRGKEQIV